MTNAAARLVLCLCVTLIVIASSSRGSGAQAAECQQGSSCISVYDCPSLFALLTSKFLTQTIVRTLRQAQCTPPPGVQSAAYVCCRDSGIQARKFNVNAYARGNPTQIRTPSDGMGHLLPANVDCGIESTARKIIGGSEVELDEFPWMALLEYERHNGSWALECGGFLINRRYVVTAAHCVTGRQVSDLGRLINVRLGEYNTETEEDCVQLDNTNECADPVQHFAVEEVVVHEDYAPVDRSFLKRENDIALVRLSGNVRYSEFVSPICLPSAQFPGTPLDRKMVVAGWGRTLVSRRSAIKLKVTVPPFDHRACRQIYERRNIDLVDSQLCAGGNYAEDSCTGDSGSPLMSRENGAWIAEGIVSFGLGCGVERPAVYTRVQAFLPWIKRNLKP